MQQLVKRTVAASMIGVTMKTFDRLIEEKSGPSRIVIGRSVYFMRDDIDQWIASFRPQYKSQLAAVKRLIANPNDDEASDEQLVTSDVAKKMAGGVTDMCIWRWLRDERVGFPQPIKINKRNYWRLGDLRAWQDRQSER